MRNVLKALVTYLSVFITDGPMHLKGQGGRNGQTTDVDDLVERCSISDNPTASIEPYNDSNKCVAIELICEPCKVSGVDTAVVNGVKAFIDFLKSRGVDASVLFHTALTSLVPGRRYVLIFKAGKEVYTKLNVLPGVNIIGKYGECALYGEQYKTGMHVSHYEFHGVEGNEIPPDYLDNMPALGDWFDYLYDLDSPFSDVRLEDFDRTSEVAKARLGFHGEDNISQLVYSLCKLRASGDNADIIKGVAIEASQASTPEITRQEAIECAQYVYRRHQKVFKPEASTFDPLAAVEMD